MKLPIGYRWLKAHGFSGFQPWWFIETPGENFLRIEYQKETGKDFYPFAGRQHNDDVAGFKVRDGKITNKVINVHLTWAGKLESDGFPLSVEYVDIFDWLAKEVINETAGWASEEDLVDLKNDNA